MANRNTEQIKSLESDFVKLGDENTIGQAIGMHQGLPGIREFWAGSQVRSAGVNYASGLANGYLLTNNNNARVNINKVPYFTFNGTNQYLSHADDPQFDVTGTELDNVSPGLTLGGWFRSTSISTQTGLIGKFVTTSDQRAYWLQFVSSTASFSISPDGTIGSAVSATSATLVSDTWYHVVGRFIPSSELSVFVNGTESINTTSIPASIFNSTAGFEVGALNGGGLLFDGDASLWFICSGALTDNLVLSLYHRTKNLFV